MLENKHSHDVSEREISFKSLEETHQQNKIALEMKHEQDLFQLEAKHDQKVSDQKIGYKISIDQTEIMIDQQKKDHSLEVAQFKSKIEALDFEPNREKKFIRLSHTEKDGEVIFWPSREELEALTQKQNQDIILTAIEFSNLGEFQLIFGDETTDFTAKSTHTRRYDIPEKGKVLKKIEICYKKKEETQRIKNSANNNVDVTLIKYSVFGFTFYDKQDKTIFTWTSNCDASNTVELA